MCECLFNGPTPQINEAPANLPDSIDPYQVIEMITNIRIDQLKTLGFMHRESQITDEWMQDDHFDELAKEFAYVAGLFGLVWPPKKG